MPAGKPPPLLPEGKLGPVPRSAMTAAEHDKNNLPDALARWRSLVSVAPDRGKSGSGAVGEGELGRPRTTQSFRPSRAGPRSSLGLLTTVVPIAASLRHFGRCWKR